MHRRFLALTLAALTVVAFATPGSAGKKKAPKPRQMELTYTNPAYGTAGIGLCFQGESCLFYGAPLPKEKYFQVEIKDQLGSDVYASVIQDTNGDGSYLATDDLTVGICGKTTEPIEIEPNKPVSVWVWQGPGVDPPCAGTATSGTATATFSATG